MKEVIPEPLLMDIYSKKWQRKETSIKDLSKQLLKIAEEHGSVAIQYALLLFQHL